MGHVLDGARGRTNPSVAAGMTRQRCGLLSKHFDHLLLTIVITVTCLSLVICYRRKRRTMNTVGH